MRIVIAATIAAAATAVKQTVDQIASMHDTVLVEPEDYSVSNYDELNAEIANWYETIAKPFIQDHRDDVANAALHKIQSERGQLLATCAEGTRCREENRLIYEEIIKEEWRTLMKTFRKDVETTILKTETLLNEGWDKSVQCEQDFPCCEVSEVVWDNLQIQINETRNLITTKRTVWEDLERRRIEMETECPDVDFTQYQSTTVYEWSDEWTTTTTDEGDWELVDETVTVDKTVVEAESSENVAVGTTGGPPML